jgi:hypothetical protein
MDNLPTWVVTIAAVAVGLSPGLALLLTRPIVRLLHRVLSSRAKIVDQPGFAPTCEEPPVSPLRQDESRTGIDRLGAR